MLNQDLNFKMQLFFIPELTIKSKQAILENTESFHLHKVLRKNIGDKLPSPMEIKCFLNV